MDSVKEKVRNRIDVDLPSISLVVPCYMRDREDADRLDRLLSSAFKQTLPFDSVIIVDDGSEFRSDISFENVVLVRLRKNSGPARARNVGMEEALKRGSGIIFFTDHDCILDQEWSSRLVGFMKSNSVQAAGGVTISYGKTLIDEFHDLNKTHHGILGSGRKGHVDYQPTCNFAITDRIAREFKFDENFILAAGEDVDYCLRVRKKYDIGYCEDAIVHHDYGYRNFISGTRSFIRMFKRYRGSLFILFTLHSDYFGKPYAPPPPFKNMVYDLIRNIVPNSHRADRNSGRLIFYVVKSMVSGYTKNVLHFIGKVDRISRIPPFFLLKSIEHSISYWYEPKVGLFRNYKHELTYQMSRESEKDDQESRIYHIPEKEKIPVELVLKGIRDMARYLSRVTVCGSRSLICSDDVLRNAGLTAELGIPMTIIVKGGRPGKEFLREIRGLNSSITIYTDTLKGEGGAGTYYATSSGRAVNGPEIPVGTGEDHAPQDIRCFAWLNIIILSNGDVVKSLEHCGQDPLGNLRKDDLVSILSTRRANRIMREMKR